MNVQQMPANVKMDLGINKHYAEVIFFGASLQGVLVDVPSAKCCILRTKMSYWFLLITSSPHFPWQAEEGSSRTP
jgi:hypothetical protein